MSELIECIDGLTAEDILRRAAKTANGVPFYINVNSGYCSAFRAIYDAFTTKPSNQYAGYWNTMVCDLVDAGYWTLFDVFYFYAVHNNGAGEALINWKLPGTYNATAYNAPTFTAYEGFTGNGTTQYIDCNWNPSANGVNYTQNSASAWTYVRNNVQEDRYIFGCTNAISYSIFRARSTANTAILYLNSAATARSMASVDSRGLWAVMRTSVTANNFVKNGVITNNAALNSNGVPNANMFVMAYNNNGSAAGWSTNQVSCFFAGAGLSQSQITGITNIINICMTSMGKNVF